MPPEDNKEPIGENTKKFLAEFINNLRSHTPDPLAHVKPVTPVPKVEPVLFAGNLAAHTHDIQADAAPPQAPPVVPTLPLPKKKTEAINMANLLPQQNEQSQMKKKTEAFSAQPVLGSSPNKPKGELSEKEKAMLKALRKLQ